MRERAVYFEWQVLGIFGIVQWYHQWPRRRRAGVRCPERGLWRPAMGSSCVVTINTWVPSRRIICCWSLRWDRSIPESARGPGPAVRCVIAARGGDGAGRPMSVLMLVWGWG